MNATSVPQGTDLVSLLTLIGTWALVGVASITVIVTAWQTRKGQKLLNKQVEESIAQTSLQQQQFTQYLDERERPRIEELIQRVLTLAIGTALSNNLTRTRSYLEEEFLLSDELGGSLTRPTKLAFDGFKADYPELAQRIKRYDERIIDLRNLRAKLSQLLVSRVTEIVPGILKDLSIPPEWRVGQPGYPGVDAHQIVALGILSNLQEKKVSVTGIQGFLWAQADKFMALADEPAAKSLIDEMKKIAQQSYDEGVKLMKELEELRESLGKRYRIPREEYFGVSAYRQS